MRKTLNIKSLVHFMTTKYILQAIWTCLFSESNMLTGDLISFGKIKYQMHNSHFKIIFFYKIFIIASGDLHFLYKRWQFSAISIKQWFVCLVTLNNYDFW